MDELLEQFLIEGRELVQQASEDLMYLDRGADDPAQAARSIDGAFRAVHTLKGSAALFDMAPMGRALTAAEDALGALRERQGTRPPQGDDLAALTDLIDPLLACIGATDRWLEAVARAGCLPETAAAEAQALVRALTRAPASESQQGAPAAAIQAEPAWLAPLVERHAAAVRASHAANQALVAVHYAPAPDCFFRGDDPLALARGVPGLVALALGGATNAPDADFDPFACTLVIDMLSTAPLGDLRHALRLAGDEVELHEIPRSLDAAAQPSVAKQVLTDQLVPSPLVNGPLVTDRALAGTAARTLRVDAARVDGLVDIAGELIVAQNRLAHLTVQAARADPLLARSLAVSRAEMDRLVNQLHRQAMRLRMMGLDASFRRFPRLVRETAASLGKQVAFSVSGGEVEADRTIIDMLHEPLLHLLRNAVDHGVEPPAARAAAGKAGMAAITLAARREADQIIISVSDDGAGMDLAAVRRAAVTRLGMSNAAAEALDDGEAAQLIFTPGFTTAATVSDISGRGVGLDSVRTAVESMGGRVAVRSVPGAGTTIQLSLPQAVTLSTVLIVQVGAARFGVPMEAVLETVRIQAAAIRPMGGGQAFVLHQQTVPLLDLGTLLRLPQAPAAAAQGAAGAPDTARILVVSAGGKPVGVRVDGFADRMDVLLRPMPGLLAEMPGLRGTALLGDGSVLLVLDIAELAG